MTTLAERPIDTSSAAETASCAGELLAQVEQLADSGEIREAQALAVRAGKLAQTHNDDRGVARSLSLLGLVWRLKGDHRQAVQSLRQALHLLAVLDDPNGQIVALCELGRVHFELDDYASALDLFAQAEGLLNGRTDRHHQALVYHHFGMVYHQLQDEEQARRASEHALQIWRSLGNSIWIAKTLNHLGLTEAGHNPPTGAAPEAERARYQRALAYFEEAASHAAATGNHQFEMRLQNNMAAMYSALGDVEQALVLYRRRLHWVRQNGQRQSEAISLRNIADVHRYLGQYDEAIKRYQEAIIIAVEVGNKRTLSGVYRELSKTLETTGDFQNAFHHFKLHHAIEQEIFNDETKRKADLMAVRQEIERAQQEMEIQRRYRQQLEATHQQLAEQATLLARQAREDGLTEVANRRHLEDKLSEVFAQLKGDDALQIAMVDVDSFKQVNDRASHAVGDQVLRVVADIISQHIRSTDTVGRYGGDEFVILLPSLTAAPAVERCEHIRDAVANYAWAEIDPILRVTVSIGLASASKLGNPEQLLALADQALYEAKRLGRNRVVLHSASREHIA